MVDKFIQENQWFEVSPIEDCPHLASNFAFGAAEAVVSAFAKNKCRSCSDPSENWMCLRCFDIVCSRHVKAHGVEHFEETNHSIVVSFSDLSFWCYSCESYIKHPTLQPVYSNLHVAKFGSAPRTTGRVGHFKPEYIEEHFDTEEDFRNKANQLVQLIKDSKHCIVFTGAGISTSAGIPDYRGPQGVWTLKEKGEKPKKGVSMLAAFPTATHMSLVKLVDSGIVKYIVSQNVDGIHRKSGIKAEKLSELHGNTNLEICEKCGQEYLRDFHCNGQHEHYTGRQCSKLGCHGKLKDSIIHFGENLPTETLKKAYDHGNEADLCIVLGSSLTVSPASDIPRSTAKQGKLVIVNLQRTPLDHLATLKIHCQTDKLISHVMEGLGIPIPRFVIKRRILIGAKPNSKSKEPILFVYCFDENGLPASVLRAVEIQLPNSSPFSISSEPFLAHCPSDKVSLELCFMGHYGEPTLLLDSSLNVTRLYSVTYDPLGSGKWEIEQVSEVEQLPELLIASLESWK
eukprot:TRINITY_DN5671_c0_g1_i1.p1 TRINITY_DN5671_c0_g1~~TRINITY_DN5671_c0_g1_i1.p1  ORF type:complete len:513 (-),score=72.83 TRINITY_DN5671_c0_g1_i1:107-1645(-)